MAQERVIIDGNEAAATIAYQLSEVIAIYPITPSSNMGEASDQWASEGKPNLWGTVPSVVEMQSEGGASGAVHGALTTGALTTTFTSSQGLLLMIPNMFKIAGELTPTVFHIAARAIATHALSIFGDHSDVMSVRSTGWAQLSSCSIQEILDLATVAHASTLKSRVPFLHFFDGFRTSHELMKVELPTKEVLAAMMDEEAIRQYRERGLSPDHPTIRGTAQNPDVFFQARETCNSYYDACPGIVQGCMDAYAKLTGRHYHLFDYVGSPQAERVIVMMGSGAEAAQEAIEVLHAAGEKVGLLKVRLFRPWSSKDFVNALPKTVKAISVLDRTKEPGAIGEPMYQDVITAISEQMNEGKTPFTALPKIVGGRYGLSSKEFTPAMVKGVLDELKNSKPKNHFTVGIVDDLTHTSISYDPEFDAEGEGVFRGIFYGLGSDGTVGANKNSIKIIGEDTDFSAQGYFVYDSKKAGTLTTSHLRFGPKPIHSTYLVRKANFVACHQWVFLEKFDILGPADTGATFLLNSPFGKMEVWDHLPREVQDHIIKKKLKFYVIDAHTVAKETGMGGRTNTIMQTAFFAISNILPRDESIAAIKRAIKKTYGKRGEEVVKRNYQAVDQTLANLHEVSVPAKATSTIVRPPVVSDRAPKFVKEVTATIIAGLGDSLPVSAFPVDGTFPSGTTQWEKRNIALEIPVWDPEICIQCGKCAMVCPHAAIRQKVFAPELASKQPATFKHVPYKGKEYPNMEYSLQVAPEDCTGCKLCVEYCPVKNKKEVRLKAINMATQLPLREPERANYEFFLNLPEADRRTAKIDTIKGSQFLQPLFEYSGACAGCGETPYIKLVTQLFGDRAVIANATGCSSIYGANLPTTPYSQNRDGRGPAWANSLFEDNAEFGLGYRLTLDKQMAQAKELVHKLASEIGDNLVQGLLTAKQDDETGIFDQRERVKQLKAKLQGLKTSEGRRLLTLADFLAQKSVWIIGGDGWAYDIGYGGLDHVLASGKNVNVLVLDTEVYSNTGGQMSKATPRGAVAKFAASGKPLAKKDLALLAMMYGNVYVAKVAMGANDAHTLKAMLEAEAYDGPSLIIAYSHCINHGIEMELGMQQQRAAVESGHFPLFRYQPDATDGHPFKLDSKKAKISLKDYTYKETRYKMLEKADPERAALLLKEGQSDVEFRWRLYEGLAGLTYSVEPSTPAPTTENTEN